MPSEEKYATLQKPRYWHKNQET